MSLDSGCMMPMQRLVVDIKLGSHDRQMSDSQLGSCLRGMLVPNSPRVLSVSLLLTSMSSFDRVGGNRMIYTRVV